MAEVGWDLWSGGIGLVGTSSGILAATYMVEIYPAVTIHNPYTIFSKNLATEFMDDSIKRASATYSIPAQNAN